MIHMVLFIPYLLEEKIHISILCFIILITETIFVFSTERIIFRNTYILVKY